MFLKFFDKSCKDLNLIVFMSILNRLSNRKIITVLKSPHVNKTAQEQFESLVYRAQINIFSYKYWLLLVFIKHLKSTTLFSDVYLKIIVNLNNLNCHKRAIECLNPNNFYLVNYCELGSEELDLKCLFLNIPYYLMLFDIYGELNLNKQFEDVTNKV
jgi:hypothetical protein